MKRPAAPSNKECGSASPIYSPTGSSRGGLVPRGLGERCSVSGRGHGLRDTRTPPRPTSLDSGSRHTAAEGLGASERTAATPSSFSAEGGRGHPRRLYPVQRRATAGQRATDRASSVSARRGRSGPSQGRLWHESRRGPRHRSPPLEPLELSTRPARRLAREPARGPDRTGTRPARSVSCPAPPPRRPRTGSSPGSPTARSAAPT